MGARELGNPLGNPLALKRADISAIGTITTHAGGAAANELPTDGRSIAKAAYSKLYAAMGDAFTSADVSSGFTQPALPSSTTWASVAYGDGLFVAISSGGLSSVSSDKGASWQVGGSLPAGTWKYLAYGAGLFVAVATGPVAYCATSTDGTTWTQRTMPSSNWSAVAYGAGRFVAMGNNASAYSLDGISWVTGGSIGFASPSFQMAYGAGRFVANQANGSPNTAAYSTLDGVTWIASTLPLSTAWASVAYGNGFFLMVSNASGGAALAVSWDGTNWLSSGAAGSSQTSLVAFAAGKFFFVPSSGSTASVMDYPLKFSSLTMPSHGFTRSAAFGGGVAVFLLFGTTALTARINLWGGVNFNLPNLTPLDPEKSAFVRAL